MGRRVSPVRDKKEIRRGYALGKRETEGGGGGEKSVWGWVGGGGGG